MPQQPVTAASTVMAPASAPEAAKDRTDRDGKNEDLRRDNRLHNIHCGIPPDIPSVP
jgi:hypothetical protein